MGFFKNPKLNENIVPLGVAIQAVALFVAALFMTPTTTSSPESTGAGGATTEARDALSSLTELPRDLRRELLPVARVPEREKRNKPSQPTPVDRGEDSLQSGGAKLASLRVQNVALSGLVATPISAPMLGIPDSLDGLSLGNGAWLGGGSESARRRGARGGGGTSGIGGGGMGGQGIGGGGGGNGGYCPAPGGAGSAGGGGGRGGSAGRGRSR